MSLQRKFGSVVMAATLAGCAGSKPAAPIADPWYALTGCCTIFFAAGSAEIDRQNSLKVQDLARNIARYSKTLETTRWCISGHTDSSGDDNANQRLSTERATAVAARLTESGIRKENLEVRGY
jgi:flagellar motor protein MotB